MRRAREPGDGRILRALILAVVATGLGRSAVFGGDLSVESPRVAWIVRPGELDRDPRLPKLLQILSSARREALARLSDDWGLRPGILPVHWILETSRPSLDAERDPATVHEPAGGLTLGRTTFSPSARAVEVSIPARKFLRDPVRARSVVLHEAVHAVHASRAGSPKSYDGTPRWFREGLALMISGEGRLRVRERAAYTLFEGQVIDGFLRGLPADAQAHMSYAEAFLGVDSLREQVGEARFRGFVQRILSGKRTSAARFELGWKF